MDEKTIAQMTLLLDRLVGGMTPEQRRRAQAAIPVGLRDQLHAAATHNQATVGRTATARNGERFELNHNQVPEWIRLSVSETLGRFVFGKADVCTHDLQPSRPQPLVMAAWRPGLVACQHCTHLFDLPAGSVADRTCDGCGRVFDEGLFPAMFVVGPITFLAGLCGDCSDAPTRPQGD